VRVVIPAAGLGTRFSSQGLQIPKELLTLGDKPLLGHALAEAARALPEATRDDDELVLRVPNEHGIRSLRDVLARLGDDIAVEDLSIHTPDLDDVFFAVTGNASKEKSQ